MSADLVTVKPAARGPSLKGTDYISRAYAFVFGDIVSVLLSAGVWMSPLLVFFLWPIIDLPSFSGTFQWLGAQLPMPLRQGSLVAYQIVTGLLQSICTVGFVVQRHRRLLHNDVAITRPLRAALLPYLGYWFLAVIAFAAFVFALTSLLNLTTTSATVGLLPYAQIAVVVVGVILILKSILIFPAIAVGDRTMTLIGSEKLTRDSGIRIALAAAATTLPLAFALVVWRLYGGGLIGSGASAPTTAFVIAVELLLAALASAVFIAYASLIYAHFTGHSVPKPEGWDRQF